MSVNIMITIKTPLIFKKIPLTILLRENTEIGLENLYVDTGGKSGSCSVANNRRSRLTTPHCSKAG